MTLSPEEQVLIRDRARQLAAEAPPLSPEMRMRIGSMLASADGRPKPQRRRRLQPPRLKQTRIYRHYDSCGCLLYLGISRDPVVRASQHRDSWWFQWSVRMDMTEEGFPDRTMAEMAEREFIRQEKPVFNRTHNEYFPESIVRYLITHERWDYLHTTPPCNPEDKPELLQTLLRFGHLVGVDYEMVTGTGEVEDT